MKNLSKNLNPEPYKAPECSDLGMTQLDVLCASYGTDGEAGGVIDNTYTYEF